ncbi:MAG TPA: ubiquitin-like small modifier protein 1 [Thermoanaerobaculia bacterium]|jgi:molybdopterin converting factor small subunit|nr:ubiquitin-like small modifier protein 1 [Thermoanaerobaculia bacterium]
MPFLFVIPGPLRDLAGGRSEVRLDGSADSVRDALTLLGRDYPKVRDRIVTELGEVRPHINIFIDGDSFRDVGGLSAPIRNGAEILILPAVSGG